MSVLNIRAKHNIATFDIQLPVEATIEDLANKLLELTGVPVSGQKIIFCGKQLPKDLSMLLTEVSRKLRNDQNNHIIERVQDEIFKN